MPIKRISEQNNQTLEEFFSNASSADSDNPRDGNTAMLAFIQMVNEAFVDTNIWALTSLYRLVLLNEDNWKSPWYIIVSCFSTEEIYFEYLIPNGKHPWPGARITGTTNSMTQARKYLLTAMKDSEGWTNNKELQHNLSQANL